MPLQFVNRAYEKVVGYSLDEVVGSDFHEFQNKASNSVNVSAGTTLTTTTTQISTGGEQSGEGTGHQQQQQQPSSSHTSSSPSQATIVSNKVGAASAAAATATAVADTPAVINSPTAISPPTNLPMSSSSTAGVSLGIPMHDHILADISQGKEWEGNYVYNPKTGEPIYLTSRILPFNCHLPRGVRRHPSSVQESAPPPTPEQQHGSRTNSNCRVPTHYIYIGDLPTSFVEKSFSSDVASSQDAGYPMPRGSLKSLRKASYDIKSISNDSNVFLKYFSSECVVKAYSFAFSFLSLSQLKPILTFLLEA